MVVAAEGPEAARLTGADAPREGLAQTCVYYSCAPGSLQRSGGKKIMLNAEDEGFLNNVVEVSQVAPGYAPEGRGLVSAVALGAENTKLSDEPEADLRPLAVYRIPFAQFAQPPGTHPGLPGNRTQTPGLYLAGEYTQDSSINGSMLSGERAAGAVLGMRQGAAV
jgi:hypothetical protein